MDFMKIEENKEICVWNSHGRDAHIVDAMTSHHDPNKN